MAYRSSGRGGGIMGRRAIFAYAAQATNHAATARRTARVSEAAPRRSYAAPRISWTRNPWTISGFRTCRSRRSSALGWTFFSSSLRRSREGDHAQARDRHLLPQSVDGGVVGHPPEALVLCENSFLGRHDLEHCFERAKTRSDPLASAEAIQLGVEPINPGEAAQRANERDWGIRTKEPLVPPNLIFPAFQRVEFAGDQPFDGARIDADRPRDAEDIDPFIQRRLHPSARAQSAGQHDRHLQSLAQ